MVRAHHQIRSGVDTDLANLDVWFVAGSQCFYGPEALRRVEEHSTAIADALSASTQMPVIIG